MERRRGRKKREREAIQKEEIEKKFKRSEQEKVVDCSSVWISLLLSTTSSGLMFRGPSTLPASMWLFRTSYCVGFRRCGTSFDTNICEDTYILNGVCDRAAQARLFYGQL